MVRIENKNFDISRDKNYSFSYSRRFIPAAALVLSAVVIFFALGEPSSNSDFENPFTIKPELRSDINGVTGDTVALKEFLIEDDAANEPTVKNESKALPRKKYKVVVQANDVVTTENVEYPFNNSKSLDLDTYVKGDRANRKSSLAGGQLVSTGSSNRSSNYVEFDGFLIRSQTDRKLLQMQKARMDSLKRAMYDSIRAGRR